jgi:hypothetical protein
MHARPRFNITQWLGRVPPVVNKSARDFCMGRKLRRHHGEGRSNESLPHQSRVNISIRLSQGRLFMAAGHVAWSKQTIHWSPSGTPTGRDEDALLGIVFAEQPPQDLLPVARLFDPRARERQRARRTSRRNGPSIHA